MRTSTAESRGEEVNKADDEEESDGESKVSTDYNARSSWSSLYTKAQHLGASLTPIPLNLVLGTRLVLIINKDIVPEGPTFYTPQSPPGTSYNQYHEWVQGFNTPYHFDMDKGELKVVGGTGQAEDQELMTRVPEESTSTPRPSKYVLDLMSALFSKEK